MCAHSVGHQQEGQQAPGGEGCGGEAPPTVLRLRGPLALFVPESQVYSTFTFSCGGSLRPVPPHPGSRLRLLQLMDGFPPVISFISALSLPLETGGNERTQSSIHSWDSPCLCSTPHCSLGRRLPAPGT